MKYIILLAVVLFSITAFSQPPVTKILVADETWVVASGVHSFRLITSNDSISKLTYQLCCITKYTLLKRVDRKGSYWERSFYFSNSNWNMVVQFVDKLNKPHY